jgi:hypothetical protein
VAAFFAVRKMAPTGSGTIWILSPGHLNRCSIGTVIPFLTDDRVSSIVRSAFSGRNEASHTAAVIAPRDDPRMAAQLANFTVHGSREPLERHPNAVQFLARVEIPSSARERFNRDLSSAGMRLSSLFPDLEHLAEELSELRAIGPNGEDLEAPTEQREE